MVEHLVRDRVRVRVKVRVRLGSHYNVYLSSLTNSSNNYYYQLLHLELLLTQL